MYQTEQMIQLTTPGCHDILVFEKRNDLSNGHTGGITHFGFRLREPQYIEHLHDKVMNAGGTIIDKGEFVPGSPFLYFKDPDNYTVEIWYELNS
jgi:catechol 2,3-dioxygenase-like lactoylglutathione lyase family enzyme